MVLDAPVSYEVWKKQQQEEVVASKGKTFRMKKYQRESLLTAVRNSEPIEDWEIDFFLESISQEDEDNYKLLLDTAIYLQRTFNAMIWWFNNTYNTKKFEGKEHHAHAIMRRFASKLAQKKGIKQ